MEWNRIELIVTGRREKRRKKLLDRTLLTTRFGRGYGPVVRQTTE
jgi:hypothetical protein